MLKESLKVAGVYANLAPIGEFVSQWAVQAGLNDREIYAVQMAVDEACSNIIQHAYGGEGKGQIRLTCKLSQNGLKVTIKDKGQPFNPASIKAPDIHAPLEERDEGGLGLFLMKQLMDEVKFDFSQRGNTLILIKKPQSST